MSRQNLIAIKLIKTIFDSNKPLVTKNWHIIYKNQELNIKKLLRKPWKRKNFLSIEKVN